jgi:hypothetical protein
VLALRCLLLLALATLRTSPLLAADLAKVDRTIKKEPAYNSKKPRYCLLAFGREAKTRVWLVLDGKTLFVDRNGNGDLTDKGEQIEAKEERGGLSFAVGAIPDGSHSHTGLTVTTIPAERGKAVMMDVPGFKKLLEDREALLYAVVVDVAVPGLKGAEDGGRIKQSANLFDERGFLQFADRPKAAPVIHFAGPWSITGYGRQTLTRGQVTDLMLGFGTPEVGAGTFVWTAYQDLVPEDVHPVVEITYPPKEEGQEPIKAKYTLKERC